MAGLNFTSLAGQPFAVRTVAAAGSGQSTATALSSYSALAYHVTGADATKAVKLPNAQAGKFLVIKNADAAAATLPVYPNTGHTINGGSANAAFTLAANASALFVATSSTAWFTLAGTGGGSASPFNVVGIGSGYKLARGQHTTATATDTVVTGLATVVSVVASYDTDPADANTFVSATIGNQSGAPAAGSIIIKTWKSGDGADVTPVAADAFSKKVNWIAVGT